MRTKAVVGLQVVMFSYLVLSSGALILARWFSLAELLPWNRFLQRAIELALQQLSVPTGFLGFLCLPAGVFVIWRLRELARSEK